MLHIWCIIVFDCFPACFHSPNFHQTKITASQAAILLGADNGNRTHLYGLGSRRSTDELYPHLLIVYFSKYLPESQEG